MRPDRLRALYRGEGAGRLDEGLLLEVGWALWARAKDVARVSDAVRTGRVECPQCGGLAQRLRRQATPAAGGREGPEVRCEACGARTGWLGLREALRARPRCLECGEPLDWRYADNTLSCLGCGATWQYSLYLRRLRGRKWLPCPGCGSKMRQPERPAAALAGRAGKDARSGHGELVTCEACGAMHLWRAVRAHLREQARAASANGSDEAPAAGLSRRLQRRRTAPCPTCGHTIARPRDLVRCAACGWEGPWAAFRRTWRGEGLLTGRGAAACRRFARAWPGCRGPAAQMILVDRLLHEVHDQGTLGPLLVEGSQHSVAELLDTIGGVRRSAGLGRP